MDIMDIADIHPWNQGFWVGRSRPTPKTWQGRVLRFLLPFFDCHETKDKALDVENIVVNYTYA